MVPALMELTVWWGRHTHSHKQCGGLHVQSLPCFKNRVIRYSIVMYIFKKKKVQAWGETRKGETKVEAGEEVCTKCML